MQLRRLLAPLLALALAASGAPGIASAQHPAEGASDIDVGAALDVGAYADTDHVFVITPSLSGSVARPTAGWSVDGSYLVDVVSAASVDIVSTASRNWKEVRQAGLLEGAYERGGLGVQASASLSVEPDYTSWTVGGAFTGDLLDKDLTLLAGFYHGHDVAGRTGTPFSVFSLPLDRENVKVGATLVLDRATVGSVVLDGIFERGDPSKPYRYVPMFRPGTVVPVGAPIEEVNRLRVSARPLEQLPLTRNRFAVSWRLAHRFRASTVRFDERLYVDSWGLKASSTDARFLVDPSQRVELGPHARVHVQSAVDFWQRAYVLGPGFDVPALRTGDRELGPLVGLTAGWLTRIGLARGFDPNQWALRCDADVADTRYLDDLYLVYRLSVLGLLSLEARL